MKNNIFPASFTITEKSTLLDKLKILIDKYNKNFEYKLATPICILNMKIMREEMDYLVIRIRDEEGIRIEPSLSFHLKGYTW